MDERLDEATAAVAGHEVARLRLFAAVNDALSDAELLPFVLSQAVAGLGGLGGMVHRVSPETGTLRLAAAAGLPRGIARVWEEIDSAARVAPAEAVRAGGYVWLPLPGAGRDGDTGDAVGAFPVGDGVAAVPLPGPGGAVGALSVLTTGDVPPGRGAQAFLARLAARVGERLAGERPREGVLSPAWWQVSPGAHLEETMRAISVGTWAWDLRTGRLRADDSALRAVGLDPETFDERVESWAALVHPDDASGVFAELDRAVADHVAYSLEYRVCRPDRHVAWIEARGYVSYDEDDEPERMTGTLWETTETRMARDAVDRALRQMSDGFVAIDGEWRILYCNTEAERVLGGHPLTGRPLFEAVPDASAFRLRERYAQAVGSGGPVGADVRSPASGRWYHMRLAPVPEGLTVYFTDVTERRAAETERARTERAAATRGARVGQLTEALAQALTMRDMTGALTDRLLSLFGARGLVIGTVDNGRLSVVGSTGYRPDLVRMVEESGTDNSGPIAEVLRQRTARFVSSTREFYELYPECAGKRLPTGGKQSWAFLPLIVSGRPVGFCVISFDAPTELSSDDRGLLMALSGLIAHAFERARLYDAEHSRAQELQRGMLPRSLPVLPAVSAAARYLPAGAGMEVGGDWYDVIPLAAERVALVIGDVMGHGLPEAITMGRLRTAVHTLADLEIPPDELLARLDSLVTELGDDFYATCLYSVYDPTSRRLTFSSAGHPPPAVVAPDGTVRFPQVQADPPLGVANPPFASTEVRLEPGSLLVLYTDGLVESQERDIESGMERLAKSLSAATAQRTAAAGPGGPARSGAGRLEELCDTLTAELLPDGDTSDDAALLVARTHALPDTDVAVHPLPADPVAARQARRWVREQLGSWGLDELSVTTQSLVSELVGNVVRHAKGPMHVRLLRGRTLTCEVYDASLATPRIRHATETDEDGRGLQLVAALSHRWGARYTGGGKCIWTEQLLPDGDAGRDGVPGADAGAGPDAVRASGEERET